MESTFTNRLGMEFVLIPAGTFRMGRNFPLDWNEARRMIEGPSDHIIFEHSPDWMKHFERRRREARACYPRENDAPWHEVRITRPFYMGRYPVTQGQWAAAGWRMRDGLSGYAAHDELMYRIYPSGGPNGCPDTPVFYYGGLPSCLDLLPSFLALLNEGEKRGRYRLPTEAEWEYAARAGADKAWCCGDSRAQLADYAWFGEEDKREDLWTSKRKPPHPVGRKRPNAWGLYDMHGNVWEQVSDWYDKDYYAQSPACDPQGPVSGEQRVIRGGDRSSGPLVCQSGFRGIPGSYMQIGFRLVFTPFVAAI